MKENLSWEEPLLDESGEFHESEMPDTTARPLNLDEEVHSPTNDDGRCDLPFPEPPVAEKNGEDEHKWKNQILSPRHSRCCM